MPVRLSLVILMLIITGAPLRGQSTAAPGAVAGSATESPAIAAIAGTDFSNKTILLLHAYSYEIASYLVMDPVLEKKFSAAGLDANRLHYEFLDLSKHPDPEHRRAIVGYLDRKYGKNPVDLIIALHSPALSFLVEEGRNLFPGVPVINVIADPEFLTNEDFRTRQFRLMEGLGRPFVILPFSINADATVKNILSLLPDTRTLVVVSGSGLLDRGLEKTVRRSLAAWQGQLKIEYVSALPLEEVLKSSAALASGAAILFTIFSADPQGRTYRPPDVVRNISRAAKAPVFGLYDSLIGNKGIVGGSMPSFGREAERTVELALEILGGNPPREPVTMTPAPRLSLFDWEQLQRWGLEEKSLPPGSIVLNRPKTIWSEYKEFVLGGLAILLAQTALVTGLLAQRRRKKTAEVALREKTEELDQFFNVTLDVLCIANTDGYFLRMNPALERILGYTREELMARPFFDLIHSDDLEGTRAAFSALASRQKVYAFDNRYRCRDGSYRWLQWSSSPAGKLLYASARDVTEYKQALQALQENERALRQNQADLRELTGRLISAQEEERRHLARELHDDFTQRLAVLSIEAGKLEEQLAGSPDSCKEKLEQMKYQLVSVAGDINGLARQLHPSILDDLGLVRAIESECNAFLAREGIPIFFSHENVPPDLGKDVSLTLYRIVQEGLRNISKHACAEQITVSLKGSAQEIRLSVEDNGIGFDLTEGRKAPGLGLSSMGERVRLIAGEFSIKSRPGEGTLIIVRVPFGSKRIGE
ncbi:MAG: PAS domain S-box protein [Desulfobacterota bacterium]|nr:PAS domain S-box protein [Thermodesulfobacteriota bacterium]